jgi:tRNA(adenine34) deaminase
VSEVRIFPGAPSSKPVKARDDAEWMREALAEADVAATLGEVPVGCVVVGADGEELSRGHNLRELEEDPTAHAEIVAIRAAARKLGTWRLEGCTLFVSLEPCAMCAGALVNARIARVVWGCDDPKAGACTSLFTIGTDPRLNHRFAITKGVLDAECAERLTRFFAALRAQGKK